MVQEGDLLYIRPRNSSTSGGMIMKFESSYRGEEDLSYHGSPWYENFIACTDPVTGEKKEFGDQSYTWRSAIGYIKFIQEQIAKVKNIVSYI